jgi:hypothetical protein
VKKDLSKDVIYNARMRSLRDNGIAGTGVPVDQPEPDFATASPVAPQPPSSSTRSTASSLGSENTPVPVVSVEHADDCSLTHIELTDDHIRVVFDRVRTQLWFVVWRSVVSLRSLVMCSPQSRFFCFCSGMPRLLLIYAISQACEDYSRWAALTSPFVDRPDDVWPS